MYFFTKYLQSILCTLYKLNILYNIVKDDKMVIYADYIRR